MRNHCGCHAQPGIAVHIGLEIIPHHMAEQCKFFHGKLTRADSGHALFPVFLLQLLQLIRHMRKTLIPCDLLHGTVCLAYLWKGRCLYHGLLPVQGKPLNAAEPVIDRIPLGGQHLHNPPILHVKIHVAVQGTVVAG